ncbi:MAG TPA: FtsQ-type POTRA domain-containing protein [Candidatus Baltobacteraceae bacterium]|nr:FtsQ-type POTRA domain-containing protein [Candidatus Baltobacteraceae bacterium]
MNARSRAGRKRPPGASRSPARAAARRRRPGVFSRIRPFWILVVVAAGLAAWGAVALARAPWFRPVAVRMQVPLGSPVSAAQVRAAAAIPRDANMWLLSAAAIRRRVEAIPYVDRAEVRRTQFPKPVMDVAITVRRPSGCVRAGAREVTIDATARVLQDGCALPTVPRLDAGGATLPLPGRIIDDPDIGRLLADQKTLADAGLSLRSLGRDRWGGLDAVDTSGVTLRFGSDADLAKKAALVGPVRAGIGSKRPVRAIDLRAPGTPIVEFR